MNAKHTIFLIFSCFFISAFPMHDHKLFMQAIRTNNVKQVKKIVSGIKKSHVRITHGLHLSYTLPGSFRITHALLKSGLIGPNNRDSDGNTLIHKAIRDKKINFIKRLMNYKEFNINKKNKEGETPLHRALTITNKKNPSLNVIKIITRDPHIDFSIKDKYQQTPYEQALENLNSFTDTYKNRFLTYSKKKRNIKEAQNIVTHLNLVIDYQKEKKSKNIESFLKNKNTMQLHEILSIALHDNNQKTLLKIHAINPEYFSWPFLLQNAHENNSPQSIPFLMSRMGITPEECLSIFKWNAKKIKLSNDRKELLNQLCTIYETCSEKPLKPEIKKSMINYFVIINMLYKIFNNPDIANYAIEYSDIAGDPLKEHIKND